MTRRTTLDWTARSVYAAEVCSMGVLYFHGGRFVRSRCRSAHRTRRHQAAAVLPRQTPRVAVSLAEIVVTALKRSEPLSKAPLAISALSQDELTAAGVVGLQDLTAAAPSVEMKMVAVDDSLEVTIRGITNSDFNPGGSPAVATYVDGIYLARTQGLNGDLFDVERVEVLRGPQGTLYGRNSTGGNLNVVTADPKNTFGASVDVSYGNYNDVQTRAMVNLPITDDLAIRGCIHHSPQRWIFRDAGNDEHQLRRRR